MWPRLSVASLLAALTLPAPLPAAAAAPPLCRYTVAATGEPGDLELDVTAECTASISALTFASADRAHVRDVRDLAGNPAAEAGRGWHTNGGGLRYTVDLAQRVQAGRGSRDTVLTEDTLVAPLHTWLGRPVPARAESSLQVTIRTPAGLQALHALTPLPGGGADTFTLDTGGLSFAGYSAFSTRPAAIVTVPGRDGNAVPILVHAATSGFALGETALANWVRYFAEVSAAYWQGFPVSRLLVLVLPGGAGDNVSFGRVRSGGGATLQVVVGRNASLETLYRQDWILTHELLHLAQPFLPRDGVWLMEGMATYVEPLLRHYTGLYSADQVWAEWLRGMSTGAIGLSTQGLSRGNPYWTGALAFLATHVAIVQHSDSAKSIADCLRAALSAAGNATVRAETTQLIHACDAAIGMSALADFVQKHEKPAEFNLSLIWDALGIQADHDAIIYEHNLSAKALRQSILTSPPGFQKPELPPEVATILGIPIR